MKIQAIVNGKNVELDPETSISAFLLARGVEEALVAVEYNLSWLSRGQWAQTTIRAGDRLEIIRIMAGGQEKRAVGEALKIGGRELSSRLFLGTGKFPSYELIPQVIRASEAQVVTVALRRMDFDTPQENMVSYLPPGVVLMTNTSGARNAVEAIRIARLARAAGCGDWIKVEIVTDHKYLLPDNYETIVATEALAAEGFVVLPYMSPDLMVAKKLAAVGAAAVMPLGAPIGSNRGLRTKELVRILVDEMDVPVIVDAGIGRPSEAAEAMEMGCAAVLVNTAIATARGPVAMAVAFAKAVEAGRLAFEAGVGPTQAFATASSPLTGFLRD